MYLPGAEQNLSTEVLARPAWMAEVLSTGITLLINGISWEQASALVQQIYAQQQALPPNLLSYIGGNR
jgi:hypothetical protein